MQAILCRLKVLRYKWDINGIPILSKLQNKTMPISFVKYLAKVYI